MPTILNAFRKGIYLLLPILSFSCIMCATRTYTSPANDRHGIDPLSWGDWQNYKIAIIRKRDALKGLFEANERALITASHLGRVDRASVISAYLLGHKLTILNTILENLKLLENSRQTYALQFIDSTKESQTVYDFKHDKIVFCIAKWDTGNFVHESTHGVQFEKGSIVFPKYVDETTRFSDTTNVGIGNDYDDEIAAYAVEFAYDSATVAGFPSATSKVHSFEDISVTWLVGLTTSKGKELYKFGAGIGLTPITVESSIKDLQNAYPLSPRWTSYKDPEQPKGLEQPLKNDHDYLYHDIYRP